MTRWNVTWVGDFGVIVCTAEDTPQAEAAEFCRRQMIDWHGIDPNVLTDEPIVERAS